MRLTLLVLSALLMFVAPVAQAIDIQTLQSKSGTPIWLVESYSLPMVSTSVAFRAGSAFDDGEYGLSALTASLLDEGAGEYDSTTFQEMLKEQGARFRVGSDKLNLTANLTAVSENLNSSFELFGLALSNPRFDQEAFKRMQEATLSSIKSSEQNSGHIAAQALNAQLYGDHPFAHFSQGTIKSVGSLDVSDVRNFYQNNFTQKNMIVSFVGDITPQQAIGLVEKYIDLPRGEARNLIKPVPENRMSIFKRIERDVPQSKILMGHLSIDRHHKDYFPAYAMNYILGGGGFNSRLMEEIREKRGLAYGAYSSFQPLPYYGSFQVSTSTKNKHADESLALIYKEIHRIQKEGVSEQEYEGAMNFLRGSFPLRLDSNNKILSYLTVMQMENLGVDYLDTWADNITAVTPEDIQRVAKELLKPEELNVIIVGGQK